MRLGNPKKSGIGLSTLQRAVITFSAIRAFERGGVEANVLGVEGNGVEPKEVTYSKSNVGRSSAERGREHLAGALAEFPNLPVVIHDTACYRRP